MLNRILLDQGWLRGWRLLREDGWDAMHVMEAGLASASDQDILQFAEQEHRVCITLDHDFHANLAISRAEGPSVVLLRVERLNAIGQADLIRRIWETCGDVIAEGAPVSAASSSVRVRRLPLG